MTKVSNQSTIGRWAAASLCGLSVSLFAGCLEAPPADQAPVAMAEDSHDHGHKHAETFEEAVTELAGLHLTIEHAFSEGDADAAHGPMHEIGHLIEESKELMGTASLDEDTTKSVTEALDTLMDTYGEVDKTMHGKEGSEFSDVAETLNAALKTVADAAGVNLEEVAAQTGHDHDHDHGDHEGHDHDEEGHAEEHESDDDGDSDEAGSSES